MSKFLDTVLYVWSRVFISVKVFSFLTLSLVSFDFHLQLVNQILDPAQVLLVFLTLVTDFLDFPLHLSVRFNAFSSSFLLRVKLVLELSHSSFKFLDLFSTAFKRHLFSFIESNLKFFDSALHVLFHPLKMLTLVLLFFELFAHHGRVSD